MEDKSPLCNKTPAWQNCVHCPNLLFNTATEFESHIFEKHSHREGSIVLCQYGPNGICSALQFGDLRKAGFKYHVRQHHLFNTIGSDNWTFYSSSQNLPAVLNDPNRGKQSNFFTKTWGDSFADKVEIYPSPYLPEISLQHFESYCKKLAKRYRRHCQLKENVPVKSKTPVVETVCEVPSIFYEQSLALNDPKIFSQVFPGLLNSKDVNGTIRHLQETLSTYLDVIEMKISKQVAQKSDAFFHAMLSHDTIMEQMAKAVKTVQTTRRSIKNVKQNLTESPLQLVSLTKINHNLSNVHELFKLMATVQQTQPMLQLLLSTSDYVAALDLISSTQKVLSTRLSGIQAFRHLSPQLTEMKRLIHKMLNNEFSRFITSDLNRPIADESDLPDRDKITSIVSGILRLKELDFLEIFKTEAMTSIQTTIKQCVVEIISEREGGHEIVLRGSNTDTWLLCNEGIIFLQKVTPNIINLFKRILCLCDLILEVSKTNDITGIDCEEVWTQEELNSFEEKLKKIIVSLSDYSNERCANLIVTKNDKEYAFSDLSQLSKLSELIDIFSSECENITGHSSNAMKLALRSYAMKYIQNLHGERRALLTSSLNTERWKVADVPFELQSVINKICECQEIPYKIQYESGKPDSKFLIINKETYAVVATVQLLIKILLEYCDATKQSPDIVQYLVHCMLELIRLFNSRCCQLVLGAGAIQSAGLKTISTSNLALVSRSLQVILWLLPLIITHLEKLHSKELSLNGFKSIESDIAGHKKEIESKICKIVSGMLSSQLDGWDAKPPVPSQTFRNISKHLVKLHEALIDILPPDQIRRIYIAVHDSFKEKLREQLGKMNIVANGSPQHGVVTSELTFYLQTLKTLRIINETDSEDNILYDIWLN
ncbi:vacuolar protein sorting-associated protein 54 [Aricia agestis]|uniref:vacuolar protein sorting-associated protein 54 n=1 Tax=Aricia agestis TaxID=91739 RepID=UPI001C20AA1A|nr:vacuolar protein sorting-associated protein 54 [Aricia agestis]XP_041987405.1 vacuolar protein sorting-associated protein 54 [Aricia agestis]